MDRSIKLPEYEKSFESKPDPQRHAVPALKALSRRNPNERDVVDIAESENEDIDLHSNTNSHSIHSTPSTAGRVPPKRSFSEMGDGQSANTVDLTSTESPSKRIKTTHPGEQSIHSIPSNVPQNVPTTTSAVGTGEGTQIVKKRVRKKCKWG